MGDLVVTGIGIITALGDDLKSNHQALQEGKDGLSHLQNFDTAYASTRYFGEIKHSDNALRKVLGVKRAGVTRTSLLSQWAFEQAIKDSQLSRTEVQAPNTAFISANTVGGMCYTDALYSDANTKAGQPSPYITAYDNGASTLYIQQAFEMRGMANTINTACSSSANAVMYGARLLEKGFADRAIVGGVDSLAKFTINGFNSLYILSDEKCQPFDEKRKGLNLGEGAAYIVLEKAQNAKGKKVYAKLSGFGNANDAFHPSSISDEGTGPYNAMKKALDRGSLKPSSVDYINAHGTGTENNDITEARAMKRLFEKVPPFSSTKTFTGHTLGAAGAIEAVFSILSIHHQEIYANLRFTTKMEGQRLQPESVYRQSTINHVMSNSFGFGGNCSTLIFSAP